MLIGLGTSRSFPSAHAALDRARERADVALLIGADGPRALSRLGAREQYAAILVELGAECLGVHAEDGTNVLGFARFRLGDDPPSDLVELVAHGATPEPALAAAQSFFVGAGLEVALCADRAGRILDRLARPYFNAALQKLDEGLASAADLDLTVRLGLGYPAGPIALLEKSGLVQHFAVSAALHEASGEAGFVPARRARVAFERARAKER